MTDDQDDFTDYFTTRSPQQTPPPAPIPPSVAPLSPAAVSPVPPPPTTRSTTRSTTSFDGGGASIEGLTSADDSLNTPIHQEVPDQPAKTPQPVDKYARTLLALVGIPTLVVFVGQWIPELGRWSFFQTISDQVAPVVGGWPIMPESAFGWPGDHSGFLPTIGLLSVVVLRLSLQIKSDIARIVVVPAAGSAAVSFALGAVVALFTGGIPDGTVGVLLSGLAAAVAGRIAYQVMSTPVDAPVPPRGLASVAAIATGVTVLPAIALGRWATAEPLVDVASSLPRENSDVFLWLFTDVATLLQWVTGVALAAFLAALVETASSVGRHSLVRPIVVAVVALGVLIVAGGAAADANTDVVSRFFATYY